jgi:hypothetical protein
VSPQKFRYNAAITIAAVVALVGTVPLATSRAYLLPLLAVPVLIGVWGWRAGTDVGPAGLTVRALFGSRLVPWSDVAALVRAGRGRSYAVLTTGGRVRLPAVGGTELATITGRAGADATASPSLTAIPGVTAGPGAPAEAGPETSQ